jgi:preprotein translocase subunit Sss1
MEEHIYNLDSILDKIIEDSFEKTIKFFEKNGISTDKKPKLKVIESPYLNEYSLTYLVLGAGLSYIGIYGVIEYHIPYSPIPSIVEIALTFWMMWKYRRSWGLYAQPPGTVYIIKKPLKRNIYRLLNTLYTRRIIAENLSSKNTEGYSIIGIRISELSNIIYPAYINWNDIKNVAAKIPVDIIMAHELSHFFISMNELVASTLEYLIYFYKNRFYKYPVAYKIIKENIKQCKEYIEKEEKPNLYELGRCHANIIIDKNKQSSKVNTKDIIEEVRYLSEEDIINEIKSYKI